MAPIKFEENIREKLQERELQPSKESWEKLALQLEHTTPKRKVTFFWYAIAASLIAVLVIGSLIFRTLGGASEIGNDLVEEIQNNNNEEKNLNEVIHIEAPSEDIAQEEIVDKKETKLNNEEAIVATTTTTKNTIKEPLELLEDDFTPEKEDVAVAMHRDVQKKEIISPLLKTEGTTIEEGSFLDKKVEDVVANVLSLQKDNGTVSMEEIDGLLAKAQREIENQKIRNSITGKVDATALLVGVELELEQSFRDKVFDALGNGFEKIRTSVAERNN